MNIIQFLFNATEKLAERRRRRELELKQHIKTMNDQRLLRNCLFKKRALEVIVQWITANSLSCSHCGQLAEPIFETENRYRCRSCGRQFRAAMHNSERSVKFLYQNLRPEFIDSDAEKMIFYNFCKSKNAQSRKTHFLDCGEIFLSVKSLESQRAG